MKWTWLLVTNESNDEFVALVVASWQWIWRRVVMPWGGCTPPVPSTTRSTTATPVTRATTVRPHQWPDSRYRTNWAPPPPPPPTTTTIRDRPVRDLSKIRPVRNVKEVTSWRSLVKVHPHCNSTMISTISDATSRGRRSFFDFSPASPGTSVSWIVSNFRSSFMHVYSVVTRFFSVEDYACALVGDLLLQGHLYVTYNYFAFHSNVFGYVTKVILPFSFNSPGILNWWSPVRTDVDSRCWSQAGNQRKDGEIHSQCPRHHDPHRETLVQFANVPGRDVSTGNERVEKVPFSQ